ncbi:MAG: HlyD family efflux transporter periplasmic adaptor subunit [Acidimicrobiales bacterium]|nr:HlyD family efflux transporter periplasmic adaptor subunit [Acidimicrobiales bacterium]
MSRTDPRLRRLLVPAAIVAALLIGGAAAVTASASDQAGYRTAAAEIRDVQQVLETVGTIEPVSQAAVAFPTSGTVAAVYVSVGDQVTTGTPLADLDIEQLERDRREAQATLDQAELVLALALTGEDVSSVVAGGAPGGGFGQAVSGPDIGAAQQAVVDAQAAVDVAMADASAALANATQVCATTATTPTTTTTTEPTSTSTTAAATSATDDTSAACIAALDAALAAQQAVAEAQQDLEAAMATLSDLLDAQAEREDEPSEPSQETAGGDVPSEGTDPGGSASAVAPSADGVAGAESASSSPSAEDLVAYQKAVDAAELDVVVAQHAIDQGTIVSPVDGTVVAVGLEEGDEVTAGSSTQAITVVSDTGFEVTTTVSVNDLPDVEVGQAATVTPDGADEPLAGEIVRIGVTPDTSSITPTYDVTIGFAGDTSALRNGSTASVAIVTDAVDQALAVPTSAVAVDGDQASVQTLDDGEPTTTEVEIGAIGQSWIEITDGLTQGDEIVLADLDEPLPGSATDGSGATTNGPGGFGGFGGPGG